MIAMGADWSNFWSKTGDVLANVAASALDKFSTNAANQMSKWVGMDPAKTPLTKAEQEAKARAESALAAKQGDSTLKTAMLVGIPVVGLLAAIAVWRMSK